MLTKEENQLLINKFVEKNVDSITNLNDDKQKAIFNAILLIQNKFGNITQSLLKDDVINPKVAQPIAIIEEELPFKVGDVYLLTINSGDTTLTILEADKSNVKVKYADGSTGMFELDNAISRVERGVWKKVVVDLSFQLGQFVWDKQQSELVIIGYKANDILELVSYRQKRNKSIDTLEEDIKLGASILLKFKVGDNFIDNDGNKYEIYGLTPNSATDVMVIKNRRHSSLLWEYIDNKIIFGEWKLVDDLPFKVGDAFKVSQTQLIFRIEDIKDDNVFMVYEDGLPATASLRVIKDGLKSGYYVPNATFNNYPTTSFKFNVGDTFEVVSNKSTWTIVDIVKDFDEYIIKNDDNQTTTPIKRQLLEEDVEFGRLVQIVPNIPIKKVSQIVKNQQITTSTTTTTTSKAITIKTKTTSTQPQTTIVNKDEDIEALEEAIETQKLLLTLTDTKEEKDEIKNLLKDLRSQLKFLKK